MKVMSVVGARPNFMKVAPIIAAARKRNELAPMAEQIDHVLLHTGQHHGRLMSDSFFEDLDLPAPDVHLGVGPGSQTAQTAEIMARCEQVLLDHRPDFLIVVGDVNSTLACAMAASKIAYPDTLGRAFLAKRPVVCHVEAGLRSFDRSMPEEINRVLTDHISDLLFATEESALRNLAAEGVSAAKVHLVGNTMIDSLLRWTAKADESTVLEDLHLRNGQARPFALLTLHRPSNVDQREDLAGILESLGELAKSYPVVFPVHPRTRLRVQEFGLEHFFRTAGTEDPAGIRMVAPLGYLDFLYLMKKAALVVTDSGGIQEETTSLGVPCVTVRENTERPVTVQEGTNVLAGTTKQGIQRAIVRQLTTPRTHKVPDLWDGRSSDRILDILSAVYRSAHAHAETDQPRALAASPGV